MFRQIRRARPEVACTTPVTAAFAAFKALGARRIGVLTPYSPDVNAVVRAYLDTHGADVAAFATFDKRDDREAARISVDFDRGRNRLAGAQRASLDAVFVSCTSLRLAEHVEAIEAGGRRAGHLQRSCAGLALPAAGGRGRHRAGRRAAVQMRHRLMTPSGSRHS